jgi:mRNA-degrading endonuclease RelE of RelBE toxin-antitoxin system
MSDSRTRYSIVCQSRKVEKDWLALETEFPEKIAELKKFLTNNPEDRSQALGKLKKLHGPFKELLQYDITKNDVRVWYLIDRKKTLVIIKYAGHHPDW